MDVLVLGASGMLGHTMLRVMCENEDWQVLGTVRSEKVISQLPAHLAGNIISDVDIANEDSLEEIIRKHQPDIVINCIGVTKNLNDSDNPLVVIPINSVLPHRLEKICTDINSRVIHISTDCVFAGDKGNYKEDDIADARDLYGLSKCLGELHSQNAITLRTSIIGHEIQAQNGLLEWFLSQEGHCKGYVQAIFSGLPTVTLAEIIRDHVIPNKDLSGLYHVAGPAIAKYDLLKIIAKEYNKNIDIVRDEALNINRSLNADKFQGTTGYIAPDWPSLVKSMHNYN